MSLDLDALRAVVWDVDDTLFLEQDYARSGFEAVGAHVERTRGIAGFGARLVAMFEAGVRGDTFDRALAEFGAPADKDTIRELVEIYRGHTPRISLLPDARAALDAAVARGWRQAALTDGPPRSQRAKVEALGLAAWCDPIVLAGELGPGRGKPAPDAFLVVERALGLTGSALLYVGDNPPRDFPAPWSLGWQTLRIRREGSQHVTVPTGAASAEVAALWGLW